MLELAQSQAGRPVGVAVSQASLLAAKESQASARAPLSYGPTSVLSPKEIAKHLANSGPYRDNGETTKNTG